MDNGAALGIQLDRIVRRPFRSERDRFVAVWYCAFAAWERVTWLTDKIGPESSLISASEKREA